MCHAILTAVVDDGSNRFIETEMSIIRKNLHFTYGIFVEGFFIKLKIGGNLFTGKYSKKSIYIKTIQKTMCKM